jgi:NAD-dependent DNA ligase
MDIFTKFNRNKIADRQIDTLIGLSKGMLIDGKVDQAEAEYLLNWLAQSRQASDSPIILNLLSRVNDMLADGVLDRVELLALLSKITGESSEIGELAKTTSLPLDEPFPQITFPGKTFLFTGTCAFGARIPCHEATESLGGIPVKGVTKKLDYLVLGAYVSDSWAHENFGRKIEKAMQYRDSGVPLAIVSEAYWAESGNFE